MRPRLNILFNMQSAIVWCISNTLLTHHLRSGTWWWQHHVVGFFFFFQMMDWDELGEYLFEGWKELKWGCKFTLQEKNLLHSTKRCRPNPFFVLKWLSQIPDPNQTKNMWHHLKIVSRILSIKLHQYRTV